MLMGFCRDKELRQDTSVASFSQFHSVCGPLSKKTQQLAAGTVWIVIPCSIWCLGWSVWKPGLS